MAYKTSNAIKRHLQEKWEAACNGYLLELANMWELDCKSYGFWIGNDVGGTFSYGDTGLYIDMDNVRYCVENDIAKDEYMEWLEYCVWASEFEQNVPNLKSWHMGCPRVDETTQERLLAMKRELCELIEETKTKF